MGVDLKVASCCNTCVGCNSLKPKWNNPIDTHAAHYTVAKTERWCFKFNIPTVREGYCDDFELDDKKGGIIALKRALKQNRRLEAIINKAKELKESGEKVKVKNYVYFEEDGYLKYYYEYGQNSPIRSYKVSCKDTSHDDFIGLKK